MNANTKTHIATALTAVAGILVALPGILTTPPFTINQIAVLGNVLALGTITVTALKQWLSAEVNSSGVKVTLVIALITILTGIGNAISAFHLSDIAQHWIAWAVSAIVLIFNIVSKIVFPSGFQQDKVQELKTIAPEKTNTKN